MAPAAAHATQRDMARFLTIDPSGVDAGNTAIRVRLQRVDGYPAFNNHVRWLGPPQNMSDPGFTVGMSLLQCYPHFRDWSTLDTVYVYGTEVVPESDYVVQVIREGCEHWEAAFSPKLELHTNFWGDVAEPYAQDGAQLQPDFGDIDREVEAFQQSPAASEIHQFYLQDNDPFGRLRYPFELIGFLDISAVVAAFQGRKYHTTSTGDPNRVPCDCVGVAESDCTMPCAECSTNCPIGGECPTAFTEFCAGHVCADGVCTPNSGRCIDECGRCMPLPTCEGADIRADIDEDGDIDDDDDALEDLSPGLIVYVNDDDDNENGVPDMDETSVTNENDLVEMTLGWNCDTIDPAVAWWSLSWNDTTPPSIQVWLTLDKSDGAGTPIQRDVQQPWPPPLSVWTEAIQPLDEFQMRFQFSNDGVVASSLIFFDGLQTRTISAYKFNLRVIMLVENGADPDNPPPRTGGCKLPRTNVISLVRKLIQAGNLNQVRRGIQFLWDGVPEVLESNCMNLLSPPLPPPLSDASVCMAFMSGATNGNPRTLPIIGWFDTHVVDRDPHEDEAYLQGNGDIAYLDDGCTINIYFAGNSQGGGNDVWGATAYPGGFDKPFIIVNDGAVDVPNDPHQYQAIFDRKTVLHEVACHYLTHGGGYPSSQGGHPAVPPCPGNVCVSGADQMACFPGGIRSGVVPRTPVQDAMRVLQCAQIE